jgi:hypothetical protein
MKRRFKNGTTSEILAELKEKERKEKKVAVKVDDKTFILVSKKRKKTAVADFKARVAEIEQSRLYQCRTNVSSPIIAEEY